MAQKSKKKKDTSSIEENDDHVADGLEEAWQDLWDEQGEILVWHGWVQKYPDYIDPTCLDQVPPAIREEVVVTSEEIVEVMENPGDVGMEEKTVKAGTDIRVPSKDTNRAIESKMIEVVESGVQSEESAKNNSDLVKMMHDYSASSGETASDKGEDKDENVTENYDDQWKDLWDEHYVATYWYYCQKFREHWEAQNVSGTSADQNEDVDETTEKLKDLTVSDAAVVEGMTDADVEGVTAAFKEKLVLEKLWPVQQGSDDSSPEHTTKHAKGDGMSEEEEPEDGKSGKKRKKGRKGGHAGK